MANCSRGKILGGLHIENGGNTTAQLSVQVRKELRSDLISSSDNALKTPTRGIKWSLSQGERSSREYFSCSRGAPEEFNLEPSSCCCSRSKRLEVKFPNLSLIIFLQHILAGAAIWLLQRCHELGEVQGHIPFRGGEGEGSRRGPEREREREREGV